jgi:hypothetical protein
MDSFAINVVDLYNNIINAVGADTLRLSATPAHGYMIMFCGFFLLFGNGFFFFWQRD